MKSIDLLQTASSNMLRSKARTLLTVIAIFIGAMTITLTNGIGTGIKSYLNRQIGNLGATNVMMIQLTDKNAPGPGSASSAPAAYNPQQKTQASGMRGEVRQLVMTSRDISTIKSIPNITSATPEHVLSADYIMGTGGKYQLSLQQQFGSTTADMLTGRGVGIASAQNQITLPDNYVSPLGYTDQTIIGKPITIGITSAEGKQSTVVATVTGVQQKTLIGASAAFINTALANQLYAIQSTGLPSATADSFSSVEATFPTSLTDAQITTLKNALSAKGYSGQTIKDRENTVFTVINVIIIVFDMFGAIALLAASFGIINTLFMAVQERTKEIGLMKALGMSPKRIFTLFSIEAALIGFWGSALGVGFAALLGKVINTVATKGFLKDFPGLTLLTFPLTTVVAVIVGIMLIAFLAGTLPAFRASRKDPIEALRYE
ncbi:MAG TPA: FtsX-like permease family protein [Candidatus Dormibacteraeota bacterium]|nr:FtsX-like permease family protein [Candidatus Dormibacteraeota bacterium]